MGGITGIDWTAVIQIAKALDIKIYPATMEALHELEKYELKRMAEEVKHGE